MIQPSHTKHTIWLRPGDMEKLRDRFPQKGASFVIRKLVADFVDRLDRPLTEDEIEGLMEAPELEETAT